MLGNRGEKRQEIVISVRSEERVERNPCRVYKSPDGALPLFIGGGDRLGGEGVLKIVSRE